MLIRVVLLACVIVSSAAAVEVDAASNRFRAQIMTAERVVDQRFQSVGDDVPMAVVGTARGAYIDGYGVVFNVQVNMAPVGNISPFRRSYSAEEIRQLNIRKRQRIETIERRARDILVEVSALIKDLPADEKIAVAVSLFHFAWEDLTGLPRQMVMSALKSVLVEAKSGTLAVTDFRRSLHIRYY
jgi:hypothetical protein